MAENDQVIGETMSVCPVCLQVLPARKVQRKDGIYLEKHCHIHGGFGVLIWRGDAEDYASWQRQKQPVAEHACQTHVKDGCPYDCGLCEAHKQQICCVLLEVTQRCNLNCPVCFASAGKQGANPSLHEIGIWYDTLRKAGGPFNIQLSGGEPTMRDDLAEIIRLGKEKGFTYFQLNTNGLRLAEDADYLKELVAAGLNNVFLQFDGVTEAPYQVLRGKALLENKLRAINHCQSAGVGVVLVPTIASGVNDLEVGELLKFAFSKMPVVRGIHFQPVSYFGRNHLEHNEQRITIPDMLQMMEAQTGGMVKRADFLGGGAENSYCSFHANYMQMPDGTVQAIKSDHHSSCCTSSKQSRDFVARRWSVAPLLQQKQDMYSSNHTQAEKSCCCLEENHVQGSNEAAQPSLFDVFLERIENYTLAVSGMLFQDAWNLDLERLQSCYLCEFSPDKRIVPFCAYNLTNANGETLYRGKLKK